LKLLLDQNLSPRLREHLANCGATIVHVRDIGLEASEDALIWAHAAQQDFMIVTKDADFNNRAFLFGPPPKVVWIRRGNCGTRDIEALLRAHHAALMTFAADVGSGLLILE
jgi:predicted nuclease of predicted toxin-antitoxin system